MKKTILTKKHLNNFSFAEGDWEDFYSKKYNLAFSLENGYMYIEGEVYDSQHGNYKDAFPIKKKLLTLEDFKIMLTALTNDNFI